MGLLSLYFLISSSIRGVVFETAQRRSCSTIFKFDLCFVFIPKRIEKVDSQSQVDGNESNISTAGSAICGNDCSIFT